MQRGGGAQLVVSNGGRRSRSARDRSRRNPKRRTRAVATKTLATEIVGGLDAHARMKIEPLVICRFVLPCRTSPAPLLCLLFFAVFAHRRRGSALHREVGARIKRLRRRCFVGARFKRQVVDVPMSHEPSGCAATHALENTIELVS